MLYTTLLPFLFGSVYSNSVREADNGRVVCYLGTWATYRQGDGNFEIEDVDPFLCTHLIYAFVGISSESFEIRSLDPWQDLPDGKNGFNRAVSLKIKNPSLKVILGVGGWNEGSQKYSQMASTSNNRKAFITSSISLLKSFDFDGLDIDWEYPAQRGGRPEDKENLNLLLSELKCELHQNGMQLSIAVAMGKEKIEAGYDVPLVSQNVDFINMMTYDFRGSWDRVTGHHTQMYKRPEEMEILAFYNVNASVNIWIEMGAEKQKLNIGTAFYGRTYTAPGNEGKLDFPSSGPGKPGIFTKQGGILGYNELCLKLVNENGWNIRSDEYVAAPWMFKNDQFVAFDDAKSVALTNQWAKDLGLGGGMLWSIETDDFRGHCKNNSYPLLKSMNEIWRSDNPKPPTTTTSTPNTDTTDTNPTTTVTSPTTDTTNTIIPPTTSEPIPPANCTYGELKPDLNDCTGFYVCSYITVEDLGWIHLTCAPLFFDPSSSTCVLECPW